jgi:lysophospholipase L1-like esterase
MIPERPSVSDTGKKIILLTVAAAFSLGAVEIVLRVMGYGVITPEMNFGINTQQALDQGRFQADPDLFWKLPVHPRDVDYRAVQPDVPVSPKGAKRRILVMGDSCSRLSTAIPPYSVLLEDSLRAYGVEVFNAAVPGYTTWQGRAWLKKQLLAMEPDLVVVYFGWNDHWRATGITDRDYAQRLRGSTPRLALLFRKMPEPPPLRVPVDAYRENLLAIVEELEAAGAKVTLVTAPSNLTQEARTRILQTRYLVRGDDAGAMHQAYLKTVHEVSESTNASLLDASAAFAAARAPQRLMMRDGIHLTDKGHRLMTTLLAAHLAPDLSGEGSRPDVSAQAQRAHQFMQTDGVR